MKKIRGLACFNAVSVFLVLFSATCYADSLLRDFTLPIPLFASDSPWNDTISQTAVISDSDDQILTLYRVLRGDITSLQPTQTSPATTWPFIDINYDSYSIPIFKTGTGSQFVSMYDYEGTSAQNNPKIQTNSDGTVTVPSSSGSIRPAGPQDTDSDGHLVLFDSATSKVYDFWQATTERDTSGNSLGGGRTGTSILDAGAIDFFDLSGSGTNTTTYSSARATGSPLVAGLLLPEDVETGKIAHALAFAIPGPRNLNTSDPFEPYSSDYFNPASTTETDFYNTNASSLAAGQRIRLKQTLVDEDGLTLDETKLSPVTQMFLATLRTYGAYMMDNAGGFTFYAEDIHTANLNLTDDQVNTLINQTAGTAIPQDKTKWQVVLEKLTEELELLPLAYGPWQTGQDPATATITTANFEVVENFSDSSSSRSQRLNSVTNWMYQIQELDQDGAIAALAATEYQLLVLEPGHNFNDSIYDTASIISQLRTTPFGRQRLLVAYIDVGQAEDYRDYWGTDWIAPTATTPGSPDFLVTIDPDGWSGNYPVAYWKTEWKNIWLGTSGIIATLAGYGFDGVYLDWVEAYDDDKIRAAATTDNVNAEEEMITFIEEIGKAGQAVTDGFLVIPQNAPYLLDTAPDRYVAAIDALAVEDTWFHGAGDADWNDADAGDLHERHDDEWSTANRLTQYKKYQDKGLPVFSIDYCISESNAASVYQSAASAGLIPLASRVSLSKLSVTPPSSIELTNSFISGLDLGFTSPLTSGDTTTFTATGVAANSSALYYRFDLIPNYGTSNYDPFSNYEILQDFSTSNSYTHTFTSSGDYILVVFASPILGQPGAGVSIMGANVSVDAEDAVHITSLDLNMTTTTLQTGNPTTFTVDALSPDSTDIYYRFDLIPNYGTDQYDPTNSYETIQNYSTSNTCTYSFSSAGEYILVVFASPSASHPTGTAPIFGSVVRVQ